MRNSSDNHLESAGQSQQSALVGIMLPAIAHSTTQTVDAEAVLHAAKIADVSDLDVAYVGDHLLHPLPILEAIVTLSAVAAVTHRIHLGTCVLLIALRNPLWLAKQLGSLEQFAPGRLRIGLGNGGEYPAEFRAAGIALNERGQHLEATLAQLRSLGDSLAVEFAAPLTSIAPENEPTPVALSPSLSTQVPILFAGWKHIALERAARLGDGWIGYLLSAESFQRRHDYLWQCCSNLGKQFFSTGMLLPIFPDKHALGAQRRAAEAWANITRSGATFPERLFLAGPADVIESQLWRYWQAGCREFVFSPVGQGAQFFDQLEFICAEILPRLRRFR